MTGADVADFAGRLTLQIDKAAWDAGDRLVEGLKKGLEFLAVYEGIHFLGEMVTQTVEAAVGVEHLSQKLGVSTDAVQEWSFAADHMGGTAEGLQHGMQHLALGMEELRKGGTGPLADSLKALHIPADQFLKLKLDDAMGRLADGFADAGPSVNLTAAAMQAMGRAGTENLPLLKLGADGIAELRRRAHELGAVIDGETIHSFEEFEQKQKDLHAGLTGLRNTMVAALLPALTELTEGALKWFEANRVEITHALTTAMHALGTALSFVGEVLGKLEPAFRFVADAISWVWDALSEVGEAVGELIEENETLKDVLEGVAIVATGLAVVLLAPWLIAAAAVAALILVVDDLYKAMTGGPSLILYEWRLLEHWLRHDAPEAFQTAFKAVEFTVKEIAHWIDYTKQALADLKSDVSWLFDHLPSLGSITGNDRFDGASDAAGKTIAQSQYAPIFGVDQVHAIAPDPHPTMPGPWQLAMGAASGGGGGAPVTLTQTITVNGNLDREAAADLKQHAEAWFGAKLRDLAATGGR